MSDNQNETAPNSRQGVKNVANLIVTTSVGWTIGTVIGNNTNATTKSQKLKVRVAAVAFTSLANEPIQRMVSEKVDNAFNAVEKFRALHKEAVKNQNATETE